MKTARRLFKTAALTIVGFYALIAVALVYLRFLPPLTTGVQAQRRVEALLKGEEYQKEYRFIPREEVGPNLRRAVVAAEDTRFYDHRGFDWVEVQKARREAERRGTAPRGASTLTQQLVKNLFFTTHRSYVRKGLEVTITPMAELILGKDRILELYVNVIEWGPGIYGAYAAAEHYYGVAPSDLSRNRAARLAAVIPSPLSRSPQRMSSYAGTIEGRMRQMGW